MYTRTDRRVNTPAQLLAQVSVLQQSSSARGYFPEEEEHIAAYLNLAVLQVQAMTRTTGAASTRAARAGRDALPARRAAARRRRARRASRDARRAGRIAGDRIEKTFRFADYHQTMAFVNALAWIAHREDHHPDLAVHYNRCVVTFSTHDAGGVTLNDVICAAKAERLFA